jgi:hypothetical protein
MCNSPVAPTQEFVALVISRSAPASSGREVFKNVSLGFNGYWLQQLTNHEINGVAVPNSKERTVGLGPGIQLGGQGIWFRVNSYMETNVRNRPSGIKVTFRISKTVPTKEPQR